MLALFTCWRSGDSRYTVVSQVALQVFGTASKVDLFSHSGVSAAASMSKAPLGGRAIDCGY